MNLSDILADLAIERQLDLNRYVGSLQNDLSKLLRDLALDIESQLTGNISEYKEARLKRALAEIRVVVSDTFGVYSADLQRDLAQLALDEADWVIQSTNGAVAAELVSVLPKAALLERLAANVVIDNVAMPDWFKRLEGDTLFRLNQAIRSGVALGETNLVIMKRLFDFRSPNESGTVIAKTRRNLESIVRTAVQDVTQSARLATYEANADIVKAYEHNSTFDSRTSDVCIARAGLQWDAQTKEGIGHDTPFKRPPLHFACRSILLPVTKSFRELGLDVDDFEPSTRAMIDGQGPTNQTSGEFLTRKGEEFQNRTLGPGKAQLWRDGKISLTDLVNQQGNPLTLAQLREKAKAAKPVKPSPAPEPKEFDPREFSAQIFNTRTGQARFVVGKRKAMIDEAAAVRALAAQDDRYKVVRMTEFRNTKDSDLGAFALGAKFSVESVAMVKTVMPELDRMADMFGVPKLRGVKGSAGGSTIASMGDGILNLNASYMNAYSFPLKGLSPAQYIEDAKKAFESTDAELKRLRKAYDDQVALSKTLPRGSEEWAQSAALANGLGKQYNDLLPKYKETSKAFKLASKVADPKVSEWKPGDDVANRPFTSDAYFADPIDRARSTFYHEFGHHVHQTYNKETYRRVTLPPVEVEMNKAFKSKSVIKDRIATTYGTSEDAEWFAENFSLYMMGRYDLVDKAASDIFERILREQNSK